MHRSVFCFLWTAREVQEAEQKKYISCPFCSFLCLFALLKLIDLAFVTPAWQTNNQKKNEKNTKIESKYGWCASDLLRCELKGNVRKKRS